MKEVRKKKREYPSWESNQKVMAYQTWSTTTIC